ncbi:MAG: hypothetical protein QM817_32315 [Archangium sp.]
MHALLVVSLLAQLDGGWVDDSAVTSVAVYFSPGNTYTKGFPNHKRNSFQELCHKVAEGCAFNRAVWSSVMASFVLEPDGEFRKLKFEHYTLAARGSFAKCVVDGLVGKRVNASDTSSHMMCDTSDTAISQLDFELLAERIAGCVGKETPIKKLDLSWVQSVQGNAVRLSNLEVKGEMLDLETEKCVRRAATVPDFEFSADDPPPFTRIERKLTVNTWYPGRPEPEDLTDPTPALKKFKKPLKR